MAVTRLLKSIVLIALVLNALALGVFIFGTTLFGQLPQVLVKSPLMFQDLVKYYTCGRIAVGVRALAPTSPYDTAVQQAEIARTLAQYGVTELPPQYKYPIDYPPPVFGLTAGFGLLPFGAVLAIWLVLSVGVVIAGIYKITGDWRRAGWVVLCLTACALSWRTLAMGQMTWMVLGLSALYFWAFRDRRDLVAGLCLALCALKLQYALFFLIPSMMARRWRLLAVATGMMAVLAGVTLAVMGAGVFAEYGTAMGRIEHQDPYIRSMVCVRGVASWFLSGTPLGMVSTVAAIAGLAVCAWVWWRAEPNNYAWAVALTYLCALLFSPHTHSYDMLLLSVPAAIASTAEFKPIKHWRLPRNLWLIAILAFIPLSWVLVSIPDARLGWQVGSYFMYLCGLWLLALLEFKGITWGTGSADDKHDQK
jgi:hypothetical protein